MKFWTLISGANSGSQKLLFPFGNLAKPSMKDLEFIAEQAAHRERRGTCTCSHGAAMDNFSSVGVIMHLPTMVAHERKEITNEFFNYRHLTQAELWDKDSD